MSKRDRESLFWENVQKSDGCWEWQGAKRRGYGIFFLAKGRTNLAHRIAWELVNGPIQGGLFACHKCDNPSCVRPDHIFLGTAADNSRDAMLKGRLVDTGCGAPPSETLIVGVRSTPDRNGKLNRYPVLKIGAPHLALMGVKPGDYVTIEREGDGLRITPVEND